MKRQPPETLSDRLLVVQRKAAAHGFDASPARLETLFAEGRLSFTLRGVETPRPATPELSRIAELLSQVGVKSLAQE